MIELTIENMGAIKSLYGAPLVEKALATTINRVTAKAKTLVSRKARENYNVKASDISQSLTVKRARQGEAESVLLYTGSRLGLHKFAPRVRSVSVRPKNNRWGSRRKQVRVRVHKKDPLTPAVGPNGNAGFLANDGRIYARLGAKQNEITMLSGPSIAVMIEKSDVIDPLNSMLSTELHTEFSRNMDFFISKQLGAI